jgi:hypothetical protein
MNPSSAMKERTEFDYLLNRFERASQADKPAEHNYGKHRRELFAYVRDLEARAALVLRSRVDAVLARLAAEPVQFEQDEISRRASDWKLVPHEPTKEMIDAGYEQWHRVGTTADAWMAMWHAAPTPAEPVPIPFDPKNIIGLNVVDRVPIDPVGRYAIHAPAELVQQEAKGADRG